MVVRIASTPAVKAALVSAGPPYPRRWIKAFVFILEYNYPNTPIDLALATVVHYGLRSQ